MDARGERIIVFGDSLSHHGHDAGPEIWDVDQNSNRASGQPGDLLASLLAEQGAEAVRVNARVGRSAFNFWSRENTAALLESDAAFKPTKVLVVLGTNDIGLGIEADQAAMQMIADRYKAMGAEVWGVGPFLYANESLNAKALPVIAMMQRVFGDRFIDPRPISVTVGRAGDGVHFGAQSAAQTALGLADLVLSTPSPKNWMTWAMIGAGVIGVGLVWSWMRRDKPTRLLTGLDALDAGPYRVVHILPTMSPRDGSVVAQTAPHSTSESLAKAEKMLRHYKARGYTAWIEDDDGHVPVKGAMKPNKLANKRAAPLTHDESLEIYEREKKIDDLIRDPDPMAMDIAEDYVESDGEIKLSRFKHGKTGSARTSFTVSPLNPPDAPRTEVRWKFTHPSMFDGKFSSVIEWEILFNNELIRIEGHYPRIAPDRIALEREVAADGWAVAKELKKLQTEVNAGKFRDTATIRHRVVEALYPNEQRGDEHINKNIKRKPHLFGIKR